MVEFHKKQWGAEKWIANSKNYCGKILELKGGAFCSLHFHKLKTETFYILEGEVFLAIKKRGENLKTLLLKEGDTLTIEVYEPHSFFSDKPAKILEISTQHFEDDSYRLSQSNSLMTYSNWQSMLSQATEEEK